MPKWTTNRLLVSVLVTALLWSAGCGTVQQSTPSAVITAPPAYPDENCHPLPGVPRNGGTIIFALTDSVLPGHAPVPHNVSERVVFRNLYDTLVQVDCEGQLLPGLAESWDSLQSDQIWVFTLRRGAQFWDGTPVEASHVKESWIRAQDCPRTLGEHSPLIWLDARAESVQVMDSHRLAVHLPEPQADFPLLVAHAALAVATWRPGWRWPVGTGPFRIEPWADAPVPDLICLPNEKRRDAAELDRLIFRILPDHDPRDILGQECDVLMVRNNSALDYFQNAPSVTVSAMPWDRMYLLLCPPDGREHDRQRWYTGWRRDELARDVVDAQALPANEPFFLEPTERLCPQLTGPIASVDWPEFSRESVSTTLDQDLILHPAGDDDARRLAERLAVLAAEPRRPAPDRPGRGPLQPPYPPAGGEIPQALAVPDNQFPGAIQAVRAGAFILPVDRCYASACLQLSALLSLTEWIQRIALDSSFSSSHYAPSARLYEPSDDFDLPEVVQASNRLAASGVVLPLVITRAHLVTHGRLAGIRFAYDGTVLLDRAGWYSGNRRAP